VEGVINDQPVALGTQGHVFVLPLVVPHSQGGFLYGYPHITGWRQSQDGGLYMQIAPPLQILVTTLGYDEYRGVTA